jgi:hypothetical protein
MSEVPASVPLMDWLRRQRRLNSLQLELMSNRFDLDGALSAQQPELAWWAMLRIVTAAARFYLCERGVSCPEGLDWPGNTRVLIDHLASVDPALADELWQCLLQPMPAAMAEVERATSAGLRLANERFQVKQLNRDATVRDWADGVRLLREVAVGLHIAGADKWYIRAEDTAAAGLSWYDEVMAQLAARS